MYPCFKVFSLDQPLAYPHYSDDRWNNINTIYGKDAKDLHHDYDDRLRQFDIGKHKKGEEKAKNEKGNTARYWLEYLKGYHGKDIDFEMDWCW